MITKKLVTLLCLFVGLSAFAQNKGITFQGIIRDPSKNLVNASNVTVRARILSPNGCILRDESFLVSSVSNGYISLNIGNGSLGGSDPSLTFKKVFDNTGSAISSLTCINSDGSANAALSSYTPSVNDTRKLHISMTLGADVIDSEFNMRSTAFAMNAEMLNGKSETDLVNINSGSGVTQANVESIFNRYTKLDAILNGFNAGGTSAGINISGNAATATTATNVTGTVAIANGGTGATTAAGARTNLGLGTLSTMSPTGTADNTTYLRGDGTWATVSGGGGAVTSVAGRTGAVTLSSTDVSGLGPLATMTTSGTADNTKFLRGDGAWTVVSTTDATKLPLAGGTMTGAINMGSQNITAANNISATSVSATTGSFTTAKIYDGTANYLTQTYPTGGTAYTVQWPASVGTANQVLQINSVAGGVATLGWGSGAASGVSSVTATAAPIVVSGTASNPTVGINQANTTTSGYLSSADWNTFNSKQGTNSELTALSGIASTGILQRTGAGAYTTLGTSAPLSVAAGNIGIAQATTSTDGYLSSADWNTFNNKQAALGFTPLNKASNLSDLASASTARTNLGLGGAATLSVGTGAGTVAAGDDSRIVNAVQNAGSGAGNIITSIQSGNTASRPAAGTDGRVYFDTQAGVIYRDNGTSWDTVASSGGSGGTITGVTAGTGLSGGGASGSVTLNLASIANNSILANTSGSSAAPVSTTLTTLLDTLGNAQGSVLYRGSGGWSVLAPGTNGQYLQTQGVAANPQWASVSVSSFTGSLSGDVSGTQSVTSVDKIKGKSVVPVAYSSAQVLRYDGTNWVNVTLSSADLSNDSNLLKASNMPANCSASQALTFSSPTGSWTCSNIAGLDAGVITTGTIASARLPASATYWSAATGGINYASGNVGIGTSNPGATLDVNGVASATQLKVVDTSVTEGGACTDGTIGRDSSGALYICN